MGADHSQLRRLRRKSIREGRGLQGTTPDGGKDTWMDQPLPADNLSGRIDCLRIIVVSNINEAKRGLLILEFLLLLNLLLTKLDENTIFYSRFK